MTTAQASASARKAPQHPLLMRSRFDAWAIALFLIGMLIQALVQFRIIHTAGVGLPIDDTYIHLTFSRNLMRGLGMVYNAGMPVAGTTSPGWVVLLAATAIRPEWLVGASIFWSMVFYGLTGAAVYGFAQRLGVRRSIAILTGLMTLLAGRILWAGASGMEICAFSVLSLAGIYRHMLDRAKGSPGIATAFLMGLASCFRPEAYLLYALSLADHALAYDPSRRSFRIVISPFFKKRSLAAFGVYLLCVAPYMLFCLSTNGHVFANTFYAKRNGCFLTFSVNHLRKALLAFTDLPHDLISLFLPLGVLAQMVGAYTGPERRVAQPPRRVAQPPSAVRRSPLSFEQFARLLWIWPVAFLFYNTLANPSLLPHMERYLTPLLPVCLVLSALGLEALAQRITPRLSKIFVMAAFLVFIPCGLVTAWRWTNLTAQCVRSINGQQVKVGKWIAANTPEDAAVATHDVGAIAWYGERRIIDMLGLVSTDVLKIIEDLTRRSEGAFDSLDIVTHLAEEKPRYVAAFPNWYGDYNAQPKAFRRVFEARIENNFISGYHTMQVWQADWSKFDAEYAMRLRYENTGGYGQYGYAAASSPASAPSATSP